MRSISNIAKIIAEVNSGGEEEEEADYPENSIESTLASPSSSLYRSLSSVG